MSGPTTDGGPVFSRPNTNYDGNWDKRLTLEGMSLRDWLAGQALAGDFASQSVETGEWTSENTDEQMRKRAKTLWRFADAMIATRSPETLP